MGRGIDDIQDEARAPARSASSGGGRRRAHRARRARVHAAGDLGRHPARAEAARRGVLCRRRRHRSRSRPRRDHRAGVLQRRAAHGDAGCRADRRPRGAADHQRADGGLARLRPRQAARPASSPSTTSAAAPSTSRSCSVEDGVFQVLATNGDTHLGGDDIDRLLVERVLADLSSTRCPRSRRPARPTAETVQAVRQAAIQREGRAVGSRGDRLPRHDADTRRASRRSSARSSTGRSVPCRQALADAGLEPSQIDEVVLVGGSTRIPLVRRLVGELFGRTPHTDLNPDEVVALGAAVQADILITGNREMLLLDVTPLSLGIETMGGVTSKIILAQLDDPGDRQRDVHDRASTTRRPSTSTCCRASASSSADNRSLARFRCAASRRCRPACRACRCSSRSTPTAS